MHELFQVVEFDFFLQTDIFIFVKTENIFIHVSFTVVVELQIKGVGLSQAKPSTVRNIALIKLYHQTTTHLNFIGNQIKKKNYNKCWLCISRTHLDNA